MQKAHILYKIMNISSKINNKSYISMCDELFYIEKYF